GARGHAEKAWLYRVVFSTATFPISRRIASMIRSCAVAILLVVAACAGTWTFQTGVPELAKSGGIAFPMDEAQYAKFVEQTKAGGRSVTVVKRPVNLTAGARYGYNFVVAGKNRGWILDGDD